MGDVTTASGAKIFIGPAIRSSVDTASEFVGLTFVEIGTVESLGEFGDEANIVNFASLNDGRQRKSKGVRDAGNLALTCGRDPEDPGQAAMIAAEATNNKFAFKVTYPDRLTPTGTDTIEYFRGLVSSKKGNIGNADNIIRRMFQIAIDSAIVEVPAT